MGARFLVSLRLKDNFIQIATSCLTSFTSNAVAPKKGTFAHPCRATTDAAPLGESSRKQTKDTIADAERMEGIVT